MKAIVVMFDTLNRRMLFPYSAEATTPNFERLAERSATFERCYAGSMPCMPARRELHTARYNFLHRSWGPLEPFDDSVPEMLRAQGIYAHLVTDHQHYWEDGGANYHTRFSTFELIRGQEGDPWKGHVEDPVPPKSHNPYRKLTRQDWVNRSYVRSEADMPQSKTFEAGLEFLATNAQADNWFLQIETFDPHEPFFVWQEEYDADSDPVFDWPAYRKVVEAPEIAAQAVDAYRTLLEKCDRSLGAVLDVMDAENLWEDTMLIVCTDHGLLLGEHGWWGKSSMPWFDETIHTPLYVWDPRSGVAGQKRQSLVQTIDIAATLLDFFAVESTPDMQGRPLADAIADDTPVRDIALFGAHGGHVCITDGRYVYMRASPHPDNQPLFEYTLMPSHMRSRFSPRELAGAELSAPFSFTKGAPVLKIPAISRSVAIEDGTLLFDLVEDPEQRVPLTAETLELRMAGLLVAALRASEAPDDQFERLGLPREGPVTREHLLATRQFDRAARAQAPAPRVDEFEPGAIVVSRPIGPLLGDPDARDIVVGAIPAIDALSRDPYRREESLIFATSGLRGITTNVLAGIEAALQELGARGKDALSIEQIDLIT